MAIKKKSLNQDNYELNNTKLNTNNNECNSELFDLIHYSKNLIREQISCEPPKNTLSYLVYHNKIELLQKKLKQQIDPNQRDNIGKTFSWTPLYWSVKLRNHTCIQMLLEHCADINIVINDMEECCGTVLDLATLRGDKEIEELIQNYAEQEDVNLGQAFKSIRTKLRGKPSAFNFRFNKEKNNNESNNTNNVSL